MRALTALERAVSGEVLTDPDVIESYRRDLAVGEPSGVPVAVLRARSVDDLIAALRWAADECVPVVPRGRGTGLSGGANAIDGCLMVSTEMLTGVVDLRERDRMVDVLPGTITTEVDAAATACGLWYPPDPSSKAISSIGGNVATNAGGLCCVRYGTTREYVADLDLVMLGGTQVRLGHRTRKGVSGLDLRSLVVGSEGTLGLIARIGLRLVAAPPAQSTVVASYHSMRDAAEAVDAAMRLPVPPTVLEIMDRTTVAAVERRLRMGLDVDAAALLLARTDLRDAQRLGEALSRTAASCLWTDDPLEAEAFFEARRQSLPALEHGSTVLLDDISVPPGALTTAIERIEGIAARERVTVGTFGHAGDGNLHPTVVVDPERPQAAFDAFAAIVDAALDLGGTATGEHGIGTLKRAWLVREHGADALALMAGVRAVFDPMGLMNPGKAT